MTAVPELYVNLGCCKPQVRVDPPSRRVWLGDQRVHLTVLEFQLLALLIRRAGETVSLAEIIRALYGTDDVGLVSKVRGVVCRLRSKLGDLGEHRYVRAAKPDGYTFQASLVAEAPAPLDAYTVCVVGGRLIMPCYVCAADLLAGEPVPVKVDRVQELAAWHELDHWAGAS